MIELTNAFLIQILIFLLVFIVTFQILLKILQDRKASAIISFIVSLIAIFYMSTEQFKTIEFFYSTSSIIILIAIPFLIAFFFIYNSDISHLLRKVLWIFIGIIAFSLIRNSKLSYEIIEKYTIGIIILIIILLIFDKKIKEKITLNKHLKRTKK